MLIRFWSWRVISQQRSIVSRNWKKNTSLGTGNSKNKLARSQAVHIIFLESSTWRMVYSKSQQFWCLLIELSIWRRRPRRRQRFSRRSSERSWLESGEPQAHCEEHLPWACVCDEKRASQIVMNFQVWVIGCCERSEIKSFICRNSAQIGLFTYDLKPK